jgi:hypothetical protein
MNGAIIVWKKLACGVVLLVIGVLSLPPNLSFAATDVGLDNPEVALRSLVRANAEKDLPGMEKIMAKDPDTIGYTIGGRKFVGWNVIAQALQEEFSTVERLEIPIKELHVWKHGEIAWFAMEIDYIRHLGKDQVMTLPLRNTGVLKRRDGHWVLVNWHESLRVQELDRNRAARPQK